MSADPDLKALEDWAGVLLQKLSTSERRKLSATIGRELRQSQQRRIRAQKDPDGRPFAPRKVSKARPATPMHFLYRKPNGQEREAELRSWAYQGDKIVGYDREAGGLRSFKRSRIVRHLPSSGSGTKGRLKQQRIKQKAMFKKIASNRNLRVIKDPNAATVAFFSRTARIAGVHQYGLRDKPNARAPKEVQYQQRRLLGFTDHDVDMIKDLLLEHLAGWDR